MAVETTQFRVVGVDKDTGEDVSIVLDAATKAAAEVKAEKLNIDTTHIVRMKRHDDPIADEHTQYAMDASEARSTTPTDKLIEEVVPQETPREKPTAHQPPAPPAARPQTQPTQEPVVLAAVSRPAYSAPSVKWSGPRPTGRSAILFVLAVLLGIAGGGYYVLVQEPGSAGADEAALYDESLFDDGSELLAPNADAHARLNHQNAFGDRGTRPRTPSQSPAAQLANNTPPTQTPVVRSNTPAQPADNPTPPASQPVRLELQSVVVSHEGRFAVINGKMYPQGASLHGCTLLNIADSWVLMDRSGEQFMLRIVTNEELERE